MITTFRAASRIVGNALTTKERRNELVRKRTRFVASGAQDICVLPGGMYLMIAIITSTFIATANITNNARRYIQKREYERLKARIGNKITQILSVAKTTIE